MVGPNLTGRLRATTSRRAIETGLRGGWRARSVGAALLLSLALIAAAPAWATTFTVTNLNDSGAGSLRDAINQSNAAGVGNIINFDPALSGGIPLASDLPTLTNSVTINFPPGPGTAVFLAGTGGVVQAGVGTTVVNQHVGSSYTGDTQLQSGTFRVANSYVAISSALVTTAGSTLDLTSGFATFASLSGNGAVNIGAGQSLFLTGNIANTSFSGTLSGAGDLLLFGGGHGLTLMTPDSRTGATTLDAIVFLGSGTAPFTTFLRAGAANVFSPNSAFSLIGAATLDLNNFNQTIGSLSGFGGTVLLGSATLTTGNDNTSTEFIGTITGTGGLTKVGTGILTLTSDVPFGGGSATYTGATLVTGGVLQAGDVNSFAPLSAHTINAGATLDLNNFDNAIGSLAGLGAVTLGSGTLTTGFDNTSTIFGGTISGTGGLVKAGTGVFTLTGSANYSGATIVALGTLRGGAVNAFSAASAFMVNAGATLDLNNFNQAIGSLSGAGSVTLGSATLTTGLDNTNTDFTGVVSGTGGLIKVGSGTLFLEGVNTYTGLTTVNGGALVIGDVNNPGASIAGNVAVNTGGTLAGHGTIFGNVADLGGVVMPGGTIGVLSVGGTYTQNKAGTLVIEVSPSTASQLKVGGAANLAGTLLLVFDPGNYGPMSYKIVTAASVTGTFDTVLGTNPSKQMQSITYDPTDVILKIGGIVAPTNDTIYTALTSTLVSNAQQANGIILDRLGNRSWGIADAEVALGGGIARNFRSPGSSRRGTSPPPGPGSLYKPAPLSRSTAITTPCCPPATRQTTLSRPDYASSSDRSVGAASERPFRGMKSHPKREAGMAVQGPRSVAQVIYEYTT